MDATSPARVEPTAPDRRGGGRPEPLFPTLAYRQLLSLYVATLGIYRIRYYQRLRHDLNAVSPLGFEMSRFLPFLAWVPVIDFLLFYRCFSQLESLAALSMARDGGAGAVRKPLAGVLAFGLFVLFIASRIPWRDSPLVFFAVWALPMLLLHSMAKRVIPPYESTHGLRQAAGRLTRRSQIAVGLGLPIVLTLAGMFGYHSFVGTGLARGEVVALTEPAVSLRTVSDGWRRVDPGTLESDSPGLIELHGPEMSWAIVHHYDARSMTLDDVVASRRSIVASVDDDVDISEHRDFVQDAPQWIARSVAVYFGRGALADSYAVTTLESGNDIFEAVVVAPESEYVNSARELATTLTVGKGGVDGASVP